MSKNIDLKYQKIFQGWKIIIYSLQNSIKIKLFKNNIYETYEENFYLNDLQNFKLFSSYSTINEISKIISEIMEKENIIIKEEEKNLKILLKNSLNLEVEFVLKKKLNLQKI